MNVSKSAGCTLLSGVVWRPWSRSVQVTAMAVLILTLHTACGEEIGDSFTDTLPEEEVAEVQSDDFGALPAATPDDEWVATPFFIGMAEDMSMYEVGACEDLRIYRSKGLEDFLGDNPQEAAADLEIGDWASIRADILRDEVVQLRCAPLADSQPAILLNVGKDGFTLASEGAQKGLEPTEISFTHSSGALRDILPKVRKSAKSAAPSADSATVDRHAETAAMLSSLLAQVAQNDRKAWYPTQTRGRSMGRFHWNASWDLWTPNPNGTPLYLVSKANAGPTPFMRYLGTNCSPKTRALLRDVYSKMSTDHCGHILANQLGGTGNWVGPNGEINVFSQDGSTNSGAYLQFENKVAEFIDGSRYCACLCKANLHWSFHYPYVNHPNNTVGGRPWGYDYTASDGTGGSCAGKFKRTFGTNITTRVQFFSN